MVMVMGTSTCHMLLSDQHAVVEGVGGVVRDGIVEGFFGYEAGQPAVGDIFGWFARLVGDGGRAVRGARARRGGVLRRAANGLLALDWWNGNRSVLVDANLSGLIVGLTLSTTAAEIYRALIEATAFSTRRILDAFEAKQIPVDELIAVGGLAERSPLLAPDLRRHHAPPDRARRHRQRLGPRRGHARRGRRGRRARRPRDLRGRGRAMARRRGARRAATPTPPTPTTPSTATGSSSTTTSAAAAPT